MSSTTTASSSARAMWTTSPRSSPTPSSHPNAVRMFKWLAAEYVCTRFPWERIVEETLTLYREITIMAAAQNAAASQQRFGSLYANFSASGGRGRRAESG